MTWDDVSVLDEQAPAADPWGAYEVVSEATPKTKELARVELGGAPAPVARDETYYSNRPENFTPEEQKQRELNRAIEETRSYYAKKPEHVQTARDTKRLQSRLPFVGSVAGAADTLAVVESARRFQKGEHTREDVSRIAQFQVEAESASEEEKAKPWFKKVQSALADMIPYALEFAATGGAYTAGRAGATKALGAAGKTLAGKIAARAAGVAAQSAANPARVVANTAQQQLSSVLSGEDQSFLEALPAGVVDTVAEIGSERAGGLIGKVAGKLIPANLKKAIGDAWMAQTGKTAQDLAQRVAEKAGWNGLVGELGEERTGEVIRGVFGQMGIGDFDFGTTGKLATGAVGLAGPRASDEEVARLQRKQFNEGSASLTDAEKAILTASSQRSVGAEGVYDLTVEAGAMAVPGLASGAAQVAERSLEKLQGILGKGFVSEQDGLDAGLTPEEMKNRKARGDAVVKRVGVLQKQIEDARARGVSGRTPIEERLPLTQQEIDRAIAGKAGLTPEESKTRATRKAAVEQRIQEAQQELEQASEPPPLPAREAVPEAPPPVEPAGTLAEAQGEASSALDLLRRKGLVPGEAGPTAAPQAAPPAQPAPASEAPPVDEARVEEIIKDKGGRGGHKASDAIIERAARNQATEEAEMLQQYPPGTTLKIPSFNRTQEFLVGEDGKLYEVFEGRTGRTMGKTAGDALRHYRGRIEVVSPATGGDIVTPPPASAVTPPPEAAEATPEASPAPAGPTTFTTAQGSTYEFGEGRTTRTKSQHQFHDPKDVGKKQRSDSTVFVDPEFSQEIGMWNTLEAEGKRIVEKDGKLILTSINPQTGKRGKDGEGAFTTNPEVGRNPVELWGKSKEGFWKGNHPGNPITSIGEPASASPPQAPTQPLEAVPAEATPEAVSPLPTLPEATGKPETTPKNKGLKEGVTPEVRLAEGETATTSSGRKTTPFPKVDTSSNRKADNTVKRVDKWLWENAIAEARSRGDDFNLRQFESENPARLPQASKDSMNEYLFGQQPEVIQKITKPLRKDQPAGDSETIRKLPEADSEPWQMTREEFVGIPMGMRLNPESEEFQKLDKKRQAELLRQQAAKDAKNQAIDEWVSEDLSRSPGDHAAAHRSAIEKAIASGKPVPPEVLKDYPDLVSLENKDLGQGLRNVSQIPSSEAAQITTEAAPKAAETAPAGDIKLSESGEYDLSGVDDATLRRLARKHKAPGSYDRSDSLGRSVREEINRRGISDYTKGPEGVGEAEYERWRQAREESETAERAVPTEKTTLSTLEQKLFHEEANRRKIPHGRGLHGFSAAKQHVRNMQDAEAAMKNRPERIEQLEKIKQAVKAAEERKEAAKQAENDYYRVAGKGFPAIPQGSRYAVEGRGGLTVHEFDPERGKYRVTHAGSHDSYVAPQPLLDNYVSQAELDAMNRADESFREAKRQKDTKAAEVAAEAKRETDRIAKTEERASRKAKAANDRYFRQAKERVKSLKGETEKKPLSKSGEPQGSTTIIGKWTIDEVAETKNKEGRFAVIHSPSGVVAARTGTLNDAKLLIQMLRDAEIEIPDDLKTSSPKVKQRFNELVDVWDKGLLGETDVGKHLAGMVEIPDAGVTGDIVLDASDLIPKGETEIHGRLKNLIGELPEFAYNPVFTVNDERQLVFKDGYKFTFNPTLVGLDESLVEPGQTVALNLRDVGIDRPTPDAVVKAVLGREFAVKIAAKKQGGLRLTRFGSKSGDTITVSGGGHNWSVTSGGETVDGKRAQKLLDSIPWTRKEQIAKNEEAADEDEGSGVASFAPPNPARQTRSTRRKTEGEQAGIAAADIQKTAERLFGVAIRHGGFNQRATGIYKWLSGRKGPPSPEVVRTREDHYASVGVVAHEVAHHLDETTKAVKGMPKDVKAEIKKLDYEPQKARAFEGWAEFLRRYMTEPSIDVNGTPVPNPGIDAPKTLAWFEGTYLPAHPAQAKAIAQFREYAQEFAQQSVFQRIGSMIADRKPQDLSFKEEWLQKQKRTINRIKTNFVDKFHTLEWIQERARELGHKGIGIYDLTMAHFLSASSHATTAFEEGVRSLRDGRLLGKTQLWSLRDHLESDGEYQDAVLYALARHTLFMQEKKPGYNTGIDTEDAENWIAEVEASGKTERFEAFAQGLAAFNNDLLKMLVDAGALPQDQADNMLRYYGGKNYFPLHRLRDTEQGTGSGAGFVNLGKAVRGRSMRGSGRQIIDPVDATVAQAMRFYGRAIQARQQHVLAETLDPKLGGVGGMGGLMDRVDPKQKVTQGNIEEILGTLVEEGIVEADDAKAMRIASQLLNPERGVPSEKSLTWFAKRHGISGEDSDIEGPLLEAAQREPDALAVISLWRPDYTPNAAKRTVVIFDKQGKPLMYEMDPDLHATATGMDDIQFGPFMSMFREAARWFKTGAVGASTGFGTANLIRDYWEFQGKAQHVKGLASLGKPPVMLGRYIAEKARKLAGHEANDRLIRLYEESGGKVYSVIGHDVESRRRYRRRRIGKSVMSKLGIALERPGDTAENALQAVMDVIAVSDAPPRLADAEAAIRSEGFEIRDGEWFDIQQGVTVDHLPEHVRIKASVAMAEATINFKRIGAKGQYIEAFMPFFNASVQAQYRQWKQTKGLKSLGKKDVEGARAARYMVYLSALAATGVAYWLLRHDDDDWREQDAYLRDGYWTWGKDGKTYLRIPKPRDAGIVSNLVENMLDAWYHDDARDTSDVLLRDFGGRLPTGGGFVRGAIETYVADYDYFRGKPLTPDYLKELPKEQQITPYTSRASDAIGQFTGRYLGTSPIQVEHLLSTASGGFYHRLTDLYDSAIEGRLGPEHIPFLRGLVIDRHQARSISDFYRQRDDLQTQAHREEAATGKVSDETTQKQGVLDGHAELMTDIRKLEGKVGKRRDYQYQPYLVGLARAALGYKELPSNPNPLTDKDAPEEIRKIVSKYKQRVRKQANEPLKNPSEYKDKDSYESERRSRVRGKAKLRALHGLQGE
jgi:hypothetical protein